MLINEIVNKKAIELWERYFLPDSDVYLPLFYPPINQNSLLFIGLNPSLNIAGIKRFVRDTPFSDINPSDYFHWRNKDKINFEDALAIELLSRKNYSYYSKFQSMSSQCGLEWEHVDLFFYRETNQNAFKSTILEKGSMNEFGREQIKLSKMLIEGILPKVIIVANAFASDIFKKEYATAFDETVGGYIVNIKSKLIPVFLASMLTGQRAMDKYSYERLLWQVKKTVNNSLLITN